MISMHTINHCARFFSLIEATYILCNNNPIYTYSLPVGLRSRRYTFHTHNIAGHRLLSLLLLCVYNIIHSRAYGEGTCNNNVSGRMVINMNYCPRSPVVGGGCIDT